MDTIKIAIIIGSIREGRFADKPARWITGEAKKLEGVEVEVIDLKDHPVPQFASADYPSQVKDGNYGNDMINAFAKRIGSADAFIMVTPEYNHGYSGALKDAIDSVYLEWNNKPVAFVAYGSVGGARAVEQLRQVAVEIQMAPIRAAVHLPGDVFMGVMKEPDASKHAALFAPVEQKATDMLAQLMWWAKALKTARNAS
jgi:NAD(P)H-dependent FMN reductase